MDWNIITKKDVEKYKAEQARKASKDYKTLTGVDVSREEKKDEPKEDSPIAKLAKYIPAEILGGYVAIDAAIRAYAPNGEILTDGRLNSTYLPYYLIAFIVLLAFTPAVMVYVRHVTKKTQIAVSAVAFIVYVFAIGGPFLYFDWYTALYGVIAAVLAGIGMLIINPES